jgi:hypothetical protein
VVPGIVPPDGAAAIVKGGGPVTASDPTREQLNEWAVLAATATQA